MRTFNILFVVSILCAASSLACMGVTSLDETGTSPTPAATLPTASSAGPTPREITPKEPTTSTPLQSVHLPPPILGVFSIAPNNIELTAACGDELALVNGANNDPCGQVVAVARYINPDTGKVTHVPSDFNWTIKDPAVAQRVASPGQEHAASQTFVTSVDSLVPQAGGVEPETDIMACTIPPPGLEVEPVCGAIIARAIINLSGSWFFAGPALGSSGAPVPIVQTGRNVLIAGDRKGTIKDLTLKFSDTQFEYQLVATSQSNMSGMYWAIGSSDKIGWFAYRYE